MYQETEIPKRGKHSMSQDLIALSFLLLDFFFPFIVINLPGIGFSAFLAMGQNT